MVAGRGRWGRRWRSVDKGSEGEGSQLVVEAAVVVVVVVVGRRERPTLVSH